MSPGDERSGLPVGTVTFVLTDIEGSTRGWEADHESMAAAVARHYEIITDAVLRHGGARPVEQGEGDGTVSAYPRASDAVACALAIQQAFVSESWPGGADVRIRIGIHTGEAQLRDESNYFGEAIARTARLRTIGHGGQTLISQATYDLVSDRLPPDAWLLDLGLHRLRDLARPEHVWALCHPDVHCEFPSLRSLDAMPNNLPAQLTSFIGREREIADVRALLESSRMVTLTGAGGCGKTRLALQVAAEASDRFPDGVWWIELAPLADPELVPAAVARALSVREVPGQPLVETLARYLRDHRTLIVLDNCEHLLSACALFAETLLTRCHQVGVLATSREPLGVPGESPWRVPSLGLPDRNQPDGVETLTQCEAVRLFIDRAVQARPNFRVTNENAPAVADICHRLDGIPLAIELSAARTRVLAPEQIATGLADRFRLLTGGAKTALPRQRTLEASVEWSHALLDEPDRMMLRRLSIFSGGFTLDAAEEVCSGDGIDRANVLDLLAELVDKSLVQMEEGGPAARYRMLETIRHYARGKLIDAGEAPTLRNRHLDFYVSFVQEHEPKLESPGVVAVREVLEIELDNLRAAMDWASESGTPEKAGWLTASLQLFWSRNHIVEGQRRLEAILAFEDLSPALRARCLAGLSRFNIQLGDLIAGKARAQEALEIGRKLEDRLTIASALATMAWVAAYAGDAATSAAIFEECTVAADTASALQELVSAYNAFAQGKVFAGYLREASSVFDDGLRIARARDYPLGIQQVLNLRAVNRTWMGNVSESLPEIEDSIGMLRSHGDLVWLAAGLTSLEVAQMLGGDYEAAEETIRESRRLAEMTENLHALGHALFQGGRLALFRGDPAAAEEPLRTGLEVLRRLGAKAFVVWSLADLSRVALVRGNRPEARRLADDAVAESRSAARNPLSEGLACLARARVEWADGEPATSEDLARDALRAWDESGYGLGIADALDFLAIVVTGQGGFDEAARLLGAVDAARERMGYVRFPIDRELVDTAERATRESLGDEPYEKSRAEGRDMSVDEAVAWATKTRGPRKRATAGWSSLTPVEQNVVKLVAEGLTNPQIGEKLFISKRTVQAHLARVFAKVGVATRAELASEFTRRAGDRL